MTSRAASRAAAITGNACTTQRAAAVASALPWRLSWCSRYCAPDATASTMTGALVLTHHQPARLLSAAARAAPSTAQTANTGPGPERVSSSTSAPHTGSPRAGSALGTRPRPDLDR